MLFVPGCGSALARDRAVSPGISHGLQLTGAVGVKARNANLLPMRLYLVPSRRRREPGRNVHLPPCGAVQCPDPFSFYCGRFADCGFLRGCRFPGAFEIPEGGVDVCSATIASTYGTKRLRPQRRFWASARRLGEDEKRSDRVCVTFVRCLSFTCD